MIEFLSNPWTIGIGGGLISGIVVFLITNSFVSRKENRVYFQNVNMANKELLYSIRPLIVGQRLPSNDILQSIFLSTAKKYGVKYTDLYDNDDIADDLTKEIVDNPFLNTESKLKYCELTEKLKVIDEEIPKPDEVKREIVFIERDKPISKDFLSLTLGVVTTFTIILSVFFFFNKYNSSSENISKPSNIFTLILTLTMVPLLALTMTSFLRYLKTKENEKKEEILRKKSEILHSDIKIDNISSEKINASNKPSAENAGDLHKQSNT